MFYAPTTLRPPRFALFNGKARLRCNTVSGLLSGYITGITA
ncbi:hypothetical protein DCCM_3287 [Desulfocucumis palustris]|uniref:Uncharacterized protein n=1 Tax=Desulfocucumis palustris TaxID=1898651 RepID=A0A2L2XD64_9FIRM|nr:hypothetical protein DCCM_3287 [Desulfocucumis palustris]